MKIDTSGTRYQIDSHSKGVWVFRKWQQFLSSLGLKEFDDFLCLHGKLIDRNKRSVVYRLELGVDKQIFYLKIHRNYFKKGFNTIFRKISYNKIELSRMMDYARAGLDELDPVAWGWRTGKENVGFLLIAELKGYDSLKDWLSSPDALNRYNRNIVASAVVGMVAKMHCLGLTHIDLFSWHVFVKKVGNGYVAHPIDLERTKRKGMFPWSGVLFLWNRANDLAVLHLTVPWPQVSFSERMRFYYVYCRLCGIYGKNKRFFLRLVLRIARHRGRKKKFKSYGISALLEKE